MTFIHLHAHTTYSFLDGYGRPEQIVNRLELLGHKACAITDHGNTFGHVAYQKAMKAVGIKPIFGEEFYVVDNMESKGDRGAKEIGANSAPHVTILAMNQKGYENLIAMSTLSWREGFYYRPRVDWDCIAKHQEGLIVLSGCVGGYPSQLCINKGIEAAWEFITERRKQIEHYYVELVPEPGLGISHQTTPMLMRIARDLNIPWVMTSDAHFPRPEDHLAEDVMLCIGLGTTMDDPERKIKLPWYQYYCTDEELLQRARDVLIGTEYTEEELQEAMDNSGELAELCNVEIPKAAPIKFPGYGETDPADVLWSWVVDGIQYRLKSGKLPKHKLDEYVERAEMEFALLKEKKFCDYILCLTDICRWAKAQNTLVMCRGSAGGCLLLWLLQCSETDSILLDLDFNRFMDVTRNDPPDIDVDFEISMKERVYEYISQKYGPEKVCQILALGLIRARVAVQDVATVYGISRENYAPLSAALDSKDDDVDKQLHGLQDSAALSVLEKYPVFNIIDGLVGQCRQTTIHAAGVLISSEPLHKTIAIINQPGKPRVSSVDKHGAADLDFLKLDLLVVSAYDVLADAVRKIGANMQWLYSLPYDDPTVYKLAQSGKVAGVFQLDGAAIRIGHEIHLDEFEELIAASALCRPGAVDHVSTYKKNKFDVKAFDAYMDMIHPIARRNVAKTYGILIYQEQVMRMCNQMGNMPMAQVHKLRKRIASASFHGFALGSDYGDVFFSGCESNGVSRQEAEYWWDNIKQHGIYCVSGDTILARSLAHNGAHGHMTIAEYFMATQEKKLQLRPERNNTWQMKPTGFAKMFKAGKCNLLQLDVDGRIRPGSVRNVMYNGKAITYTITTDNNMSIRITANHQMLTQRGYVRCDELTLADSFIAMSEHESTRDREQTNSQLYGRAKVSTKNIVIVRANGACEACHTEDCTQFEVAHINTIQSCDMNYSIYHHEDNLMYLCNSCHKRLDTAKGEKPPKWSVGRSTYETKITSISEYGEEDVYCVDMNTDTHTFIANGLVSHNSFNRAHAATYAIVGYWMLYMKAHYPDAYYESFLKHEGASNQPNQLLMKRLIREYRELGGRVEMVDPRVSQSSFSAPEPGRIVGGWENIEGIGKASASLILRNAPYTGWEDVRLNPLLPQGMYYRFHEVGVSGRMTIDQQGMVELAPWMPIIRTGEEEEAIRRQMNLPTPGQFPYGEQVRQTMASCGYVTAMQKKARTGKFKGEQIIYVLEDETGAFEWRCSSKQTALADKVKRSVKRGDYVAVSGWWSGDYLYINDFKLLKRRQ